MDCVVCSVVIAFKTLAYKVFWNLSIDRGSTSLDRLASQAGGGAVTAQEMLAVVARKGRWEILIKLHAGRFHISDIAEASGLSRQGCFTALSQLKGKGLIRAGADIVVNYHRINPVACPFRTGDARVD